MNTRLLVVALTAVVLLASPSAASADELPSSGSLTGEEPPLVNWPTLLPDLKTPYEPTSEDDCPSGRPQCVDGLVRVMDRRLRDLAASCSHDSIFALAYLRTTEEFRAALDEPDFFEDPGFIAHEGAVFARLYLEAFDAWHSSNRAATPPAWAEAFDAAGDRAVSGSGNLLLGMNAHIQRDRPFVLEAIGLTAPDGSSRKGDNDEVNVFLNRVSDDLIPEIAARFDPSIDDSALPTTVDDLLSFQVVTAWREIAWRNAERLVAAPTPAARDLVAQDIERYAASQARMIRELTSYGPLRTSASRDAFCAAQSN